MNNPELLLQSLNYKIGINYHNLGIYFGFFKQEYLLFIIQRNNLSHDDLHKFKATKDEINFILKQSELFKLDSLIAALSVLVYNENNKMSYELMVNRVYDVDCKK